MLNFLPLYMARSLVFTLIIEVTVGFILKYNKKEDVMVVALVNLLTNPVLVVSTFLVGFFMGHAIRRVTELTLELAVVLVEGAVYSGLITGKKSNPYLMSLILNGFSYGLGFIINSLF